MLSATSLFQSDINHITSTASYGSLSHILEGARLGAALPRGAAPEQLF